MALEGVSTILKFSKISRIVETRFYQTYDSIELVTIKVSVQFTGVFKNLKKSYLVYCFLLIQANIKLIS